jgi:uncharacterized lipoprotein YmbA
MNWTRAALLLGCWSLSTCASPPLTLYTLGTPAIASEARHSGIASEARPSGKVSFVVAVARVTIPDELDTEDIFVRDGSTLRRSVQGRWGSRLSLGITDRLTERLAGRYPHALVTDRPLTETPSYRVLINIGRLEVTTEGVATLDADWLVVPRDPGALARRDRAHFSATGPVATDQDVVTLMGVVLDQLAGAIDIRQR